MNILPVDVAWMVEPDVVVAVKVGAPRARRLPGLDWRVTSLLSRLGTLIPNPGTAKVSFELLVRAAEILVDHQAALAAAMAGPELLLEPVLGDIGLRDFHRLDEALQAGRQAAEEALPELQRLLEAPTRRYGRGEREVTVRFDPVCAMVISPGRARARLAHEGTTYYFCSVNCRECFERDPGRYLATPALFFGADRHGRAKGVRQR